MSNSAATLMQASQSLAGWLRAFVIAACLALFAATAWFQASSREALLRKGDADALMLSNSLAQHAADTFEVADVLLTSLVDRLLTTGRSLEEIYILDTALEAQVRRAPRIRSLIAYDRNGRQFASSQVQVPDWFDLSQDEIFKFHKATFGDAVRIGKPVRGPSTDDWLLTVSRRWDLADGSFGGVVVATIRVDYFSHFYRDFNVNGEAGISLLRSDGVMLARYPRSDGNLGKDFSAASWFAPTLKSASGTVRFVSPVDQVARVHGFQRVDQPPLLMFVGVSEASILANWPRNCAIGMTGAALLAVVFGTLGWKLAAQIDVRQLSERELSKLAMTDGLTGLKNRRAFDDLIGREWRAAEASREPLSLLLIDVDHFKAFNDTYGHPAGDACLRAIAAALEQSLHRQGDCIARYGGEEFALLLNKTGPASAVVVAERARQAVLALGLEHEASKTLPWVTISVGVATYQPGAQALGSAAALIERADRALYRAKLSGRNRTEAIAATGVLELKQAS